VSLQSNSGVYLKLNDEYKYVDLLKSDSTARKVYLPNGGYNENKYELICFYTNERKFGDAEDYITPPDRLPESETKGGETLEVMGETFSNLPKPPRHYVRREQLEQELADKLTNTERYPIVTLWGMGGIGKTSLALKVLTEISKKGIYEAIFWFSARDIDLTSEGPKSVSPEVVTKKDIAKKFKKIYPTSKKIDDDLSFIEDNLTNKRLEKPSLFVFDNFETVRNPKEIYLWIDTFIRNPNKVVITTRENRFPASFPIEVGSMSDQEALALIQDTVNTLGIADKIDESAAQEIADSSKGHPYVIKVLLGEIAKGSSTSQFRNIVASKEDVLTALFERTWKNLSPLARRAFLTLCSWKSIVPKLSLQAVLMRNIDEAIDVDAALQELKTSSLIETVESESDGKKFIDVPLAASVFGEQKLKVSSHKTAVEADADLLYKFGAMQRSDIPKGVEPRIKRFISNLFNIIKSLENYRHNYSNMLKHIARNHPPAWKHLADHINRLEGDHPEVVVEYLLQYVQTAEYSSKSIWKRIANLASKNGDVLTELTAWSEYATHSESGVEEASIAANRLNSIFHDREVDIDTDEKRVLCQKVVDELYSHDRSLTATDYSRLAWLLLHLQKVAEAETATVKGLHEDSSNKYCLNLAEQLEIDIEKITKGSRSQI
jgi:hypothetical protein